MAKRNVVVVSAVAAVVLVAAIVWFFVVPAIVASKIAAAADRRGLAIRYGSADYRFVRADVNDVTLTPKGSSALTIHASTVEATLSGLSPSFVILPKADVSLDGSLDKVLAAIDPVRRADEALPAAERLPIDVRSGTVKWKQPWGEGTTLSFSNLQAWVRPTDALVQVKLQGGRLELPPFTIAPLAVDVTRSTKKRPHVDLDLRLSPTDGGDAHVAVARDEGDTVDVDVHELALSSVSPKVPALDLSKATLDGEAHAERDDGGALSSHGKLTATKVRLPPVKVGPVSIAIGGTVRVIWKGTPKKGAPGTMKLDDARVEITLGGKTRVVKVTGDVSVGPKGEGPYLVNLGWDVGPIACTEIASDLGAGIVASAVAGNVSVHGTFKGDLGALDDVKRSMDIREACRIELDLGKGLGGLINALP